MSDLQHLLVSDWTCRVCSATHAGPTLACRRCGSDLVLWARLAATARRLTAAGDPTAPMLVVLDQHGGL